jgi:hypothetical protein
MNIKHCEDQTGGWENGRLMDFFSLSPLLLFDLAAFGVGISGLNLQSHE